MNQSGKFTPSFRLGSWVVRPDLNRVESGDGSGMLAQIEPRVMAVLLCLAEEPGRVVSRLDLLDRVWADSVVGEEILTRAVSELRRVFGDSARSPRYIETIRNHGYRLIAPVEPLEDPAVEAAPEAPPETPAQPAPEVPAEPESPGPVPELEPEAEVETRETAPFPRDRAPGFRPVWWLAALAVLLVLVVVAVVNWPTGSGRQDGPAPAQRLQAQPLTSYPGRERHPALSPDGTRVAYVRRKDGQSDAHLYIKQRDSEATLQLSAGPGWAAWPAWSPDGQNLAFVRGGEEGPAICTVSSLGGPVRVLWRGESLVEGLDWSPRGDRLVFSAFHAESGRYRLFELVLADLSAGVLGPESGFSRGGPGSAGLAGEYRPSFAPDGERLAWLALTADGSTNLLVGDAHGQKSRAVVTGLSTVQGLAWLADGRTLVHAASPGGNFNLWLTPVDGEGGHGSRWLPTGSDCAWNPTVARLTGDLAYEDVQVDQDLWQVRVLGRDPWQLETSVFMQSTRWEFSAAFAPETGPDGGRVAVVSARSGYPEIWLAERDGQALQRLTDLRGPGITGLSWSPDGQTLAFNTVRGGRRVIMVLAANGGSPRQLTPDAEQEVWPRWTPDGRHLVFGGREGGTWQLFRRPAGGGNRTRMTTQGGVNGQISSDGKTLYHTRPGEPGLWAVDLDPGHEADPATGSIAGEPRLVLDGLAVRDQAGWVLLGDQILWVLRSGQAAILASQDLPTGETAYLTALPGFAGPELGASPDGTTILFARTGDLTGDLMLLSDYD
jgi:Tol biopolymer transport system component/DNA-binding winged helix-turn-helix (wHTH) protein